MSRNVEVKAQVADVSSLRMRIESLGATVAEELHQTDTFFTIPFGRLKLREFGINSGELIYYLRPDTPGPKVSRYTRAPVTSVAAMRDVLSESLGVSAIVRKRRMVFVLNDTRIHLDQVEDLGAFMELEVVLRDTQAVADATRVAFCLLDALAIRRSDLVSEAYVDLILNRVQAS
jgi:predicted adenylyl cyclase CyaB